MPILTWNGMISSSMHFTHAFCCPGRTTYCRSSKNMRASLRSSGYRGVPRLRRGTPSLGGYGGHIGAPILNNGPFRGPAPIRYRGAPRLRRGVPSVGGMGAISGPPLHNRPAGAGKGDAGPGLQSLADLLHGGEEPTLVDERLAIVVHHDPAVDDDGVHAASVGVVDQVVQRIPERLPLRPPGVEQHEVG